jgi:hypothetical protein
MSITANKGSAGRLFVAAAVFLSVVVGAAAPGLAWEGREEVRDGVTHVLNPATPASAPSVLDLKELWRVGGDEEEEYLFGVLTQIASDEEGNIYLLDAQLNQVLVFSPDGEYLKSIGREGEGPGEFRRPSDMFVTVDGNVAVIQRMPGKVILLTADGDPAGTFNVPQPEDGGMQMFSGGAPTDAGAVLWISRFARKEASFETVAMLVAIDKEGNQTASYAEKRDTRDLAKLVLDEKKMFMGALVWNASEDGRVYTSEDFDAYHINVWNADGTLDRVIEREYTHRQRSEEEIEIFTPRVMIRRGNQVQSPEVKTSETDRDVQQIFPRADGSIWVLSSHGAFDASDGEIAAVDVFDGTGKFTGQIVFKGEGDYLDDGLHIVGDRLYVVTGLRSARRAMFGAGEESEDEEEAEPMGVICYDIGHAVQSAK